MEDAIASTASLAVARVVRTSRVTHGRVVVDELLRSDRTPCMCVCVSPSVYLSHSRRFTRPPVYPSVRPSVRAPALSSARRRVLGGASSRVCIAQELYLLHGRKSPRSGARARARVKIGRARRRG